MTEPRMPAAVQSQCAHCAGTIVHLDGETVLFCSSCGWVSAGVKREPLSDFSALAVRVDETAAQAAARKWMSKGFWKAADLADKAEFERIEGLALPFWSVEVEARTFWSGMHARTRTLQEGETRKTVSYLEPTSGELSEHYRWTLYARKDPAEILGLQALESGSRNIQADWGAFKLGLGTGSSVTARRDLLEGADPFSAQNVLGMRMVHGQIDAEQAQHQALEAIRQMHRERAAEGMERLTACDTTAEILGVRLVYLPIWQLAYRYKGRPYHLLIDAHTDEIVSASHPVGKWDKVSITAALTGILTIVFGLSAWLLGEPALWLGAYGSLGLLALHALWTALFSHG
ncbi:MAG: hypothetical protein JXR96_15255 [Deltaproteobacteria bacterium]|nr:hypothetical protein [Deltaproteobacteria bacterium]